MLADLKFRCGNQWDEALELQRSQQSRPCLTINRIPTFIKHVVNNMRQARPEIKVDPTGDGADEEIAEIRQGLIRHIQTQSHAEIAYDTAFENMATMGLGFMRVVDGWADEKSFDKDLFIQWVPNTFSVYFDPAASKPDWSDAKYCFIVEDISLAEFKARFGKDKLAASLSEFASIGDHQPSWLLGRKIRIAEYFHLEYDDDVLCELADGSTEYLSSIDARTDAGAVAEGTAEPPQVVRTRPARRPKVVWTLMSGLDILKERVWKGSLIPVIPVIGNQIELDGERIIVGMVRYSRESQRMYNYMYSCFVEAVALAPKAPFIAEFRQIEGFEAIWEKANSAPVAVLPYRMFLDAGQMAPPPQRQQAEPPIAAFIEGLKLADQNLKATFGIYEASLGQKGPQESGIAINARKVESDVATYDWIDNFTRALEHLGRVLNDLLPHYYNSEGRIVQIIREDLSKRPVVFNQEHENDEGEIKKYDLSEGKFSINISTGPAFATRRQESAQRLMELAKVYPPLMQVAGPQIVSSIDMPVKDRDAIVSQLEKAMPPELRTEKPEDKQKGQQPIPPEVQQRMEQMDQMVQQLTEALKSATDGTELARQKEEWATYRTQLQQETQLAIAQLKTGSQEAQFLNQQVFAEMSRIREMLEPRLMNPDQPNSQSSPASGAPAKQPAEQQPAATPQPVPAAPAAEGIPPGGVGTPGPTQ